MSSFYFRLRQGRWHCVKFSLCNRFTKGSVGSFKYHVTLTVRSFIEHTASSYFKVYVTSREISNDFKLYSRQTNRVEKYIEISNESFYSRANRCPRRIDQCKICNTYFSINVGYTSRISYLVLWSVLLSNRICATQNFKLDFPALSPLIFGRYVNVGIHVLPVCHVGHRFNFSTFAAKRFHITKSVSSLPRQSEKNMLSSNGIMMKECEMQNFDDIFPIILDGLSSCEGEEKDLCGALSWFHQVAEYNVPHGKKNRGLAVVMSFKLLKPDCTEEDIKLARILGWCIEMLQAFFLVTDDIMDQSVTRRGRPCWFRKEGVGLIAFNDAILLECAVYTILRKYFSNMPFYMDILELFHKVTRKTAYGQCLDMLSTPLGQRPNFSLFTLDRYNAIVKYKTGFYSFCLPVHLAMHLAGWKDKQDFKLAEDILLRMGHFFQVQDDYLDCFGDPATIGKQGTDIEDGKCSWLVVQALQRASPAQRTVIEENYAVQDEMCVKKVKETYDELNLLEVYQQFEEDSFSELSKLTDQLPEVSNLPTNIFHGFMKKIYKRVK